MQLTPITKYILAMFFYEKEQCKQVFEFKNSQKELTRKSNQKNYPNAVTVSAADS